MYNNYNNPEIQETQLNQLTQDLSTIEGMMEELEEQMEEINNQLIINNEELKIAETEANSQRIDYLESLLGIERVAETGDVSLLGKLFAEKIIAEDGVETGKIVIKVKDEETASAGKAILSAGETVVTIENKIVNENDLIFTSLREAEQVIPLKIGKIKKEESFQIEIEEALEEDIEFDWWVVSVEE